MLKAAIAHIWQSCSFQRVKEQHILNQIFRVGLQARIDFVLAAAMVMQQHGYRHRQSQVQDYNPNQAAISSIHNAMTTNQLFTFKIKNRQHACTQKWLD